MKTIGKNLTCGLVVATMAVTTVGGLTALPTQAEAASSKTWKKVAIGGAAVAGYGLLKHKGKIATAGAAVAAGSYYMYHKKRHKRHHHH
jgi:hypothetical protein